MKKIWFLFLLLPQSYFCLSQHGQSAEYHFSRLSIKNGLPEDVIQSTLQDREGYMWIGTQAGLVRYDGYNTRVYQFDQNDPNRSSVAYIYEDRTGVLWIATWLNGLYRYDRASDRFLHCGQNSGKTDSLGQGQIPSICDDSGGYIWIILSDLNGNNYAYRFDPKKDQFEKFGISEKGNHYIPASDYNSLCEDGKGNIWLGTSNGIYEYPVAGKKFISHFSITDSSKQKRYNQLTRDPADPQIIWMTVMDVRSHVGEGICRYNITNNKVKTFQRRSGDRASLGNDSVYTIQKDRKGALWFGTYNGLSVYSPSSGSFLNYTIKNPNARAFEIAIYVMTENNDGNFWCGNSNNIFLFNKKSGTFDQYRPNEKSQTDVQVNGYSNLISDRSGTPWIGTVFQGVNWLNRKKSAFTVYKNIPGQPHYFPGGGGDSFAEDKDGSIWIWSINGLYHWYKETDSFELIKKPIDQGEKFAWHFSSIAIDKKGTIWCNSFGKGLFNYDPKNHSVRHFRRIKNDSTSLSHDVVTCVYEDDRGTLWIGSFGQGLCSYDPKTNKFKRYPFIENHINTPNHGALDDNVVFNIYEDKQGTLWVGTNGGGLNKLNRESGTFASYQNQLPGFMTISNIFEDNGGNLWSGTHESGLFLFDRKTGTSKKFTEKDGLLYNGTLGLNADNKNNLWVMSQRGISILNSQTNTFSHLDLTNGLPEEPEYNLNFFKTNEGRFFMPVNNGFIAFDPEQLKPDTVPPIIHIESVEITRPTSGGKKQTDSVIYSFGKEKINLHHNENRITFNYVGIQFQNSALNQYAYKLDGYDQDWIQAGTQRKVTYTNLSPGTYTFHVRAANSDGVWNPEEQSFIIVIAPPWWLTWWAFILYAMLIGAAIWAFVNYRARALIMENVVLEDKIALRTSQLKQSLEDLKSTQTQLIQSEKMASLGELTAGIAHEIQNPLNFVNNFSEVNTELIDELKAERLKPNAERNDQLQDELLDNIKTNEQKINHHGKRADAIVKGMLLHSRSSVSAKETVNINALTEEYLKLAYHGLRAKDKSFNAVTETHLDETIGSIQIVPQEIGRVLLNLVNNAFYAVAEKKKQQPDGYEPKVTVTTKKAGDNIEISVGDNGNGIPQKIADKIFQPFFTTKPAGQGTGLGLSLSYDIVKAHGGEIKLETKEGEGTVFTVVLPKNG